MRTSRILLLATIVLITGALAGVSSAYAVEFTGLCNEAPTEDVYCPGEYHPEGTEILASSEVTISSNLISFEVTCESTVEGVTLAERGEPLLAAEVTNLTFDLCTRTGGGECIVTPIALPYQASFLANEEALGDGTMFVYGTGSPPAVTLSSCGIGSGCTLAVAENDELIEEGGVNLARVAVAGGSPATLTANAVELNGGICGTATWSATYTVSAPTPLFVVPQPSVKLCQKNEKPCTAIYPSGTTLEALGLPNASFEYVFKKVKTKVECGASKLVGSTTAKEGLAYVPGKTSTLEFTKCSSGCTVEALNTPYRMEISPAGKGNGVMLLTKEAAGSPKLKINCPGHACAYEAGTIPGSIAGGVAPKYNVNQKLPLLVVGESHMDCSGELVFVHSWGFIEPKVGGIPTMWVTY